MWEELVSVLRRILTVYEEIFQLSEKKGLALRAVSIKEMESIVRREQILIKEINKLEKERKHVSQNIAAAKKCPANKLAAAVELCEGALKEELKRVHGEISGILSKIAVCKKENDALTRQTLELMNYKINILAETKVEPTYADGGQENIAAAKLLDYKA